MSPWALFAYGRSKPPRTRLRRMLWTSVVFAFCAALVPFVVIGVVEYWSGGEPLGAVMMTFLAALLIFGAGAAVYSFVDLANPSARAQRSRTESSACATDSED